LRWSPSPKRKNLGITAAGFYTWPRNVEVSPQPMVSNRWREPKTLTPASKNHRPQLDLTPL